MRNIHSKTDLSGRLGLLWFWSDQYGLTQQIAGLSDEGSIVPQRDLGDGAMTLFHLATSGNLAAASGIGIGGTIAPDIRLAEMLTGRSARPPQALEQSSDQTEVPAASIPSQHPPKGRWRFNNNVREVVPASGFEPETP